MAVIKHTSKKGWWYITVSQGRKGKQLYIPFEGSKADAIIKDQQLNAAIKGYKTGEIPTIAEALPDYISYYKTIATSKVVENMISIFKRCLLPHFGRFQAHQIAPTLVHNYTSSRLSDKVGRANRTKSGTETVTETRTVSHRTIHKELNHLSAMTRWMFETGQAEKIPTIPKPPKSKTRVKNVKIPLTLEEINALIAQTPDDKKNIILLMTDAGLRISEALNLKKSDIDIKSAKMIIHGKGGKVEIYPILTARLAESLKKAINKNNSEYLNINEKTGKPYQSIKTLLTLAGKRAGITKKITHHVLRHSFSTILMESGASTEARKLLLRHSTLTATEHYTHTSPEWIKQQATNFINTIDGSLSLYPENTCGDGI